MLYEHVQHKIDNECKIGLCCMMSWKESSLFTPQLMKNVHDNADEVLKCDANGRNVEDRIHHDMDTQCSWSS